MDEINNEVNEELNEEINKDDVAKIKVLIETQKQELEEKDDRIKRLIAEFENFKKRSSKERENLYSSIMGDIVTSFLPIIDNLEKAVQIKTSDEEYKQGIELVLKQFKDVLEANGVKEIESVGHTFNPELHEEITSVTDDSLGVQEIKQEYRKGYMIGDKVIRHSLVVVAN